MPRERKGIVPPLTARRPPARSDNRSSRRIGPASCNRYNRESFRPRRLARRGLPLGRPLHAVARRLDSALCAGKVV
jgi:hypothetical protein